MTLAMANTQIRTREELKAVLRRTKEFIANGTLRQIKAIGSIVANDDLTTVPDDGPWPDFLEAYFEDLEGARYKLTVETYHGTGGSWERV